jgi:geranylgeranyl pyrophosphate synthase
VARDSRTAASWGPAWVDTALDEARARLVERFAALADHRLMPPDVEVTGKLLRPRLLLLTAATTAAARAPSTDRGALLAAAVEMIHLATLHHDDVLDDSPHRRRTASVRGAFGNKVSILFGDALMVAAIDVLLRCASRRMHFAVIRAATATLRGEVEQHLGHRMLDVDERDCLRVARLKTGSLFGLAARLGALLSGVGPEAVAAAHRFGCRLGTAFQLIDDALDYAAGADVLGKEPGSDYREGIATLPLVRAWRDGSDHDRPILQLGFGRNGDGDFAPVRAIVLRARHFGGCLATARRQLALALAELPVLDPDATGFLEAYADRIADRIPDLDRVST